MERLKSGAFGRKRSVGGRERRRKECVCERQLGTEGGEEGSEVCKYVHGCS